MHRLATCLQARIAEHIRQKNVEENYETAWEYNPEVFASVTMLYVNMEVGNTFPSCYAGAPRCASCSCCS